MATNKMKLKHSYRAGTMEEIYGTVFKERFESNSEVLQTANRIILEEQEIKKAISEEEKVREDKEMIEKMEYLETLDIMSLRSMVKTGTDIPNKTLIKMKKEELIVELLK